MKQGDKRRKSPGGLRLASLPNASHPFRPVAQRLVSPHGVSGASASVEMGQPVAPQGIPLSPGVRGETLFRVPRTTFADVGRRLQFSVNALGLGVNESSVLRTLVIARRLLSEGWCQRVAWCDSAGDTNPATMGPCTHFSLVGSVRTAGQGDLVGEYALRHVRGVLNEGDLGRWNDNPVRTKAQVVALLDAAVEAAGGRPRRRGGWSVREVH